MRHREKFYAKRDWQRRVWRWVTLSPRPAWAKLLWSLGLIMLSRLLYYTVMIQILPAFSHSSLLLETQAVECFVEFDAFQR